MEPQIVLITGCSSGIGLATATRLAHDNDQRYIVIATVISMSERAELMTAVGDALDKTVFIKVLDVTNDENISSVVDNVINTHGRIDVLINIAGVVFLGIPEQMPREKIDLMFSVNVMGAMRLTQAVLPHMKERRAGKIIAVTSSLARQGRPYYEFYCATKFAIEGFFESLAAGLRLFNIRVCLVEPARVATRMDDHVCACVREILNDDEIDEIDRRHLEHMHRMMKVSKSSSAEKVAEAIVERCLEEEKPALRHLLKDKVGCEEIAKYCSDVTGERSIAGNLKRLGYSS
ncbi:retinol dehydrogenase 8-like [Lytechinus variegatus]|uniref:retinol dehydrogenase 8-like n=1 Tax=Lytechinus variegatus TaxID=7654 RepID=UPI001BB1051C|nr:retinol dehydrogenase 8-like [Lytechinus variegatus]